MYSIMDRNGQPIIIIVKPSRVALTIEKRLSDNSALSIPCSEISLLSGTSYMAASLSLVKRSKVIF